VTLKDQSRREIRRVLDWFGTSPRVIAIRSDLLYYAIKFDDSDRLQVSTLIVWRTTS
jgi:hypothetical protein